MANARKTYNAKYRSKVALEALRGESTISEIAAKYLTSPGSSRQVEEAGAGIR